MKVSIYPKQKSLTNSPNPFFIKEIQMLQPNSLIKINKENENTRMV